MDEPNAVGFDSLEEMLAYLDAADAATQERPLLEPQQNISWGSYVFSALEAAEGVPMGIWGHVWSLEEYRERETKAGAEEEELDYSTRQLVSAHERGYRYGEYWSIATFGRPDIGSKHISVLWPITRRQFEYARRIDWRISKEFWTQLKSEVRQAR